MKLKSREIEECNIELQKALNEIKEIFNNSRKQIERISAGDIWSGPNANSFLDQCKETLMIDENMLEYLEDVIEYIKNSCYNYERVERSVIEQMKK